MKPTMHIHSLSEKLTLIVDIDAIELLLDIEHTCNFDSFIL